jgi:hypothetical protein
MPNIKLVRSIVILLVLQFLLGVLASMYSDIPQNHPEEVFHHFGYISLHIVNGTLLLVLGAVFLYQALKHKAYKREAISGLGAMVAAWAFGEVFVFTQNDLLSFLMAGSFIGALLPYARVMYLVQPKGN